MGSLDSSTNSTTDPPPDSNMKVAVAFLFCLALAFAQDVPDLCQPCIRIISEADNDAMIACLDKDLVDRQICFKEVRSALRLMLLLRRPSSSFSLFLRLTLIQRRSAPWLESVVIVNKCLELSLNYFYNAILNIK